MIPQWALIVPASLLAEADAGLVRAVQNERVHAQIRRHLAATLGYLRAWAGTRLASRPRPAGGLAADTASGACHQRVRDGHSHPDRHHSHSDPAYRNPINAVDYSGFVRGDVPLDTFVVWAFPYQVTFFQELVAGRTNVPGQRRLRRAVSLTEGTSGVSGDQVWFPTTGASSGGSRRSSAAVGWRWPLSCMRCSVSNCGRRTPISPPTTCCGRWPTGSRWNLASWARTLRIAVRGGTEALSDVTIDHLATLAGEPVPAGRSRRRLSPSTWSAQSVPGVD